MRWFGHAKKNRNIYVIIIPLRWFGHVKKNRNIYLIILKSCKFKELVTKR